MLLSKIKKLVFAAYAVFAVLCFAPQAKATILLDFELGLTGEGMMSRGLGWDGINSLGSDYAGIDWSNGIGIVHYKFYKKTYRNKRLSFMSGDQAAYSGQYFSTLDFNRSVALEQAWFTGWTWKNKNYKHTARSVQVKSYLGDQLVSIWSLQLKVNDFQPILFGGSIVDKLEIYSDRYNRYWLMDNLSFSEVSSLNFGLTSQAAGDVPVPASLPMLVLGLLGLLIRARRQ